MKIPSAMPRLKGYRHPREIIAYAVWAYHRFALSRADVEDLLAERGVIISRETIRLWVNRFGAHFAPVSDVTGRGRTTIGILMTL
jgi:putative transposase